MTKSKYFDNESIISKINDEKFLLNEFIKLSKRILYSCEEFKKTPEQNKKEMLSYNLFKVVSNTETCKKSNFLRFKLNVSRNIHAFWTTIILNNYYQSWKNINNDERKFKITNPPKSYYFDDYELDNLHNNIADVNVQKECNEQKEWYKDKWYIEKAKELKII